MEEIEKIGEQLATNTESIKLFKNSKGYNWEIKILQLDTDKLSLEDRDKLMVERLKELNNLMIDEFTE